MSRVLRHPPEQVFDFVADMRNDPEWVPLVSDVEQVSGDGPGPGAVWRFRQSMGRRKVWATATMTTYERADRLEWTADHKSMDYHAVMRFEAHPKGCKVIQTNTEVWHFAPAWIRPALPALVRWALRRQFRLLAKALQRKRGGGA